MPAGLPPTAAGPGPAGAARRERFFSSGFLTQLERLTFISRRTRATRSASISVVITASPSPARATTVPQGSTIIELP